MTAHVSTKQIIDYIKIANRISVDGVIYKTFTVTDTEIVVDKYTFPIDYFDVGGMDPNSLILIDSGHEWRRVQFHDENNVTLNHPKWEDLEPFDITRVKNSEIVAIANQTNFNK